MPGRPSSLDRWRNGDALPFQIGIPDEHVSNNITFVAGVQSGLPGDAGDFVVGVIAGHAGLALRLAFQLQCDAATIVEQADIDGAPTTRRQGILAGVGFKMASDFRFPVIRLL